MEARRRRAAAVRDFRWAVLLCTALWVVVNGSSSGSLSRYLAGDTATTDIPAPTPAESTLDPELTDIPAPTPAESSLDPAIADAPAPTPADSTIHQANSDTPFPTPAASTLDPAVARQAALDRKKALCKRDFEGYNKVLRLLKVNPRVRPAEIDHSASSSLSMAPRGTYPRIFCYVNTISPYHKTHAQLVADTWAQRCDKTVFFSNDTGSLVVHEGTSREVRFPIVKMNAPADYYHLWMKHKEVLTYIHDHYRHDYDWFYKADDDAYLVVESFREYLRRPEIVNNYKRQPMQLGKRFNLTAERVASFLPDAALRKKWWTQWDRWVFDSGGPGYGMNRLFLDKFVASIPKKACLSAKNAEMLPEDTSTSLCLMWEGVAPWDTNDVLGRPRWHSDNPGGSYGSEPEPNSSYWLHQFHNNIGGFRWGDNCCAPDSIGFHYVKRGGMYHVERMLYFCREGDDVADMAAFNAKYNLSISEQVLDLAP